MLNGFFDIHFRLEQLDKFCDPLVKLNEVVPWESFRAELESIRDKERKNSAGRKPFDVVVMFKILILQSLYNLSDDAVEYQIRDRLSFMRFLGFSLDTTVPDAKTVWLFREQLAQHGLGPRLFDRFDGYLRAHGFAARKGQIVDASIIATPSNAIPATKTSRSKPVIRPTIGATPSGGRRILTPAGLRKTARIITVIKIILRLTCSTNSFVITG